VVTAPVQIGSYRIERLLGIGSFATVWLGYDAALGARVAIKVLAENWSHDLRVRERFLEEARLLWRLDHKRIVRVYSLGELPDGRPYLVMAWADRGSLRDRLAQAPLPVSRSLSLLREIGEGVAVLHDNGIVHRDLTPGNVLFRSVAGADGPAERVVIADLGLAKALAAASGLTARAGTPGYMAPEQDDPLAIVDRRADVYGLGRLGVRLLATPDSGRLDWPVRLRDGVPQAAGDVLRVATSPRPVDRYRDATAFVTALDRAAGRRPSTAPRRTESAEPAAARPTGASRRRPAMALLPVLAASVGLLAGDSVEDRLPTRPGVAVDATGRISIRVPDGWHGDAGTWAGPPGTGYGRAPALLISPDPERWGVDKTVPGAFIWLSRGAGASVTPAEFVGGRRHPECEAAPVRDSRRAGVDWAVAAYSKCSDGRALVVEAAGLAPNDAGLVYVQVAPPASSTPTFVDTLLAGLQVR
jgi:tRNA A-37 threonylcarbamoyl transferase component Bud32